jgi:hypothetical protein
MIADQGKPAIENRRSLKRPAYPPCTGGMMEI